jgi:hypothetical protein
VLKYFSKVVLDVATAVHYYEAILATLAIVIWHFYAVIFDPDVYPLKWTFVNGRAPEHEVREEEEETAPQAASKATTEKLASPAAATREPHTVVPHAPVAGSKRVN